MGSALDLGCAMQRGSSVSQEEIDGPKWALSAAIASVTAETKTAATANAVAAVRNHRP
jgi:hypothetical protein